MCGNYAVYRVKNDARNYRETEYILVKLYGVLLQVLVPMVLRGHESFHNLGIVVLNGICKIVPSRTLKIIHLLMRQPSYVNKLLHANEWLLTCTRK